MEKMKSHMRVDDRKSERGAALIAVLMISFLLMVAVAALLLEASANSSNVTDATAEEQAYYAAESGIQTAVNILRNSPVPNPLIVPSASPTATVNKISYLKAARPADSNYPTDPNTTAATPIARLSRWMTYDDSYPDGGRVVLGAAQDNTGFKVEVVNPDNVGGVINFYTTGDIGGAGSSMTFNGATAADRVTITYNPVSSSSPTVVDVTSGIGAASLGKFTITATGTGATIPQRVRFTINVNLTVPYSTGKIIRGYIEPVPAPGLITPTTLTNVRLLYDSERYVALGTLISLTPPDPAAIANTPGSAVTVAENPGDPGAPSGPFGTYLSGWRIYPYAVNATNPARASDGAGVTAVTATFSAPEPIRLLIRSTGYGPRGSKKVLESIIQKNYFDDLGAPSPLTLIGPPSTSSPGTNFLFDPGNSTPVFYSGRDTLLRAFLPPIGVTNQPNLTYVQNRISSGFNGSVFGTAENIQSELPNWLQSPKKMDQAIQLLKARAISLGPAHYISSTAPDPSSYGDYASGTGITFIDRDVTIQNNTDAGGIVIVNGKLTLQGGVHVRGLIIIIGRDGFLRTGGGGATIEGNMIVAPYDAAGIACAANDTTCFMSPQYRISGGGGSTLAYNSNNVTNGLSALTDLVKGVAEK
jgi:hypothetical protein